MLARIAAHPFRGFSQVVCAFFFFFFACFILPYGLEAQVRKQMLKLKVKSLQISCFYSEAM